MFNKKKKIVLPEDVKISVLKSADEAVKKATKEMEFFKGIIGLVKNFSGASEVNAKLAEGRSDEIEKIAFKKTDEALEKLVIFRDWLKQELE